ncbi:MAG: patatin-like phospholipase family protein [Spirulina sp. SIO3F2]|nr:patatin-like phospholipase family protein [Spirulina sp. SIO3F2]
MTFKILTLDGGGMRGVLSAQLLTHIEAVLLQQTGQRLHEYFDLIAGTSTGAILASGIAVGKGGEQLVQLYLKQGRRIFPYTGLGSYFSPKRLGLILQHGLSAPKFSNHGLQQVLREQFGQRRLNELSDRGPKLLIPTYDTATRRPVIFKNWEQNAYAQTRLWEAVLCSASAPTFFPSYPLNIQGHTHSLVDGGVGANNPASCAIAAALNLGYPLKEIRLLSVGTGEGQRSYLYKDTRHWGLTQWAQRITDVLMDAPMDIISETVQQMVTLGNRYPNHYLRFQPQLSTSYLDQVLDIPLRESLRPHLKGKRPLVKEDIDDARSPNLYTLIALATGYFKNHALIYPVGYRQPKQMSLTEALQVWISSSVLSERDGFAMEEWR